MALNQKQLEVEAAALLRRGDRLASQSRWWAGSYGSCHETLQALGDVESWAKTIESDMAAICSSLEQRFAERSEALAGSAASVSRDGSRRGSEAGSGSERDEAAGEAVAVAATAVDEAERAAHILQRVQLASKLAAAGDILE